jgi:proteic killer suppression protein
LNVYIDDKELLKLYESGRSKKLRLPENVIEKFFATIQKIESATSIHDFWENSGLKFEKLKGFKNRYSMRLNIKYRLEIEVSWINSEQTIGDFTILEISSHYGD